MPLSSLKIIRNGKGDRREEHVKEQRQERAAPRTTESLIEYRFHLPHAYKHWGTRKHQTSFGDPS